MKPLFALLACLLAGCATTYPTKTLTPLDNGHEVTVKVGEFLVVELPSNHTTGYGWVDHSEGAKILGPEHYQWWLEPNRFEPQFLKTLLRPYPAEAMACTRVSKLVNNAKHDGPKCLQPG